MRIKLDRQLSVAEIASAIHGNIEFIEPKARISYVTTSSCEAVPGDLFIPLKGTNFDGEDFVSEASDRGAIVISTKERPRCIRVLNTRDALLDLAKYYKSKLKNLKWSIAITGSVGKTTTKNFTKTILSESYRTHATQGNFNNEIGLPLTVLSAPWDTEVIIAEMGMNHAGEIGRLSTSFEPDIAAILNIGTSHIGNLGSRVNIARAKLEITEGLRKSGILIVPADEPLLPYSATTFSTDGIGDFNLRVKGDGSISVTKDGKERLCADFLPKEQHLLECLSASAAIALSTDAKPVEIERGISKISYGDTRQKTVKIGDAYFLADYYNASPESVLAALRTLSSASGFTRKSVLIGDMLELGELSGELHANIGERIAGFDIAELYLFGEFSEYVKRGAISAGFPKRKIHTNTDRSSPEVTARHIKNFHIPGEIILIKASRGVMIERVLHYFEKL